MSQPIDIASLLAPDRVVVLPGNPGKPLAISALADVATTGLPAHDRVAFIRSVLEREDVTTTAIGNGIAIPHARSPAIDRCRIAIGVLPGGVRWGAADGIDVNLAVLILAREADHSEHLRTMAALATRLRQRPGLAQQVRTLTGHGEIIAAILATA